MAATKRPRGTASTPVGRLAGDIMLDQAGQLLLQIVPPSGLRYHPAPAAVIHHADGSSEPATMKTLSRPKKIGPGKAYFVSVDRDRGERPSSKKFLYLSLMNDGAPLEIWDEGEEAALSKKARTSRSRRAK